MELGDFFPSVWNALAVLAVLLAVAVILAVWRGGD
jgi:hypothetical protein